jgi:hypothetical protein
VSLCLTVYQKSYQLFGLSIARYYINYKLMKKMLKQYVQQTQHGGKDREQVLKDFSRILDDQVYKMLSLEIIII